MQAHEHHSRPQILSGMDEEGGEPICPFKLEASGWDGFPRFSPSIPFIPDPWFSLRNRTYKVGVRNEPQHRRHPTIAIQDAKP